MRASQTHMKQQREREKRNKKKLLGRKVTEDTSITERRESYADEKERLIAQSKIE